MQKLRKRAVRLDDPTKEAATRSRLRRAGLAIPGEAGHETRCVGGAYTEPPDGGRVMRLRAPLCSGARNGQAFGLAKHLTNPADRSGSGQESRQPSQRCEQSMNKYNETPSWLRPRDTRLGKVVIAKEKIDNHFL